MWDASRSDPGALSERQRRPQQVLSERCSSVSPRRSPRELVRRAAAIKPSIVPCATDTPRRSCQCRDAGFVPHGIRVNTVSPGSSHPDCRCLPRPAAQSRASRKEVWSLTTIIVPLTIFASGLFRVFALTIRRIRHMTHFGLTDLWKRYQYWRARGTMNFYLRAAIFAFAQIAGFGSERTAASARRRRRLP